MTYLDLIRDADRKIDNGDITLGEYEKMIEPLKREIQPERKTGKWIDDGTYGDYHPHHAWHCSECEESVIEIDTPWFKFCPNCGADMRKDGD